MCKFRHDPATKYEQSWLRGPLPTKDLLFSIKKQKCQQHIIRAHLRLLGMRYTKTVQL